MSAQVSSASPTPSSASAADEAAAISAGYAKGRTTVYYTDCKRLPTVRPRHDAAVASSTLQGGTADLTQLGDFSFLPHPDYAGRSGKKLNKPLFLHHLLS